MKPENILQADLLDIIFFDRNKEYGAYALRKNYDHRLLGSFGITILFALALSLVYYIQKSSSKEKVSMLTGVPVADVKLIKPAEQEKKERIEKIQKPSKPLVHKVYVVPQIVEDDLADKDLPEVPELNNKIISNIDKGGGEADNDEVVIPVIENGGEKGQNIEQPVIPVEPSAPLVKAEVMPEFPGGMEAFKKFMLRNLRQPDLNEGEKVVVRVQFVVDTDGSIKNMNILQSGGGLDSEVIRVVGKMPKWKPGLQNGRFVAVYFTLPVTFLGPES